MKLDPARPSAVPDAVYAPQAGPADADKTPCAAPRPSALAGLDARSALREARPSPRFDAARRPDTVARLGRLRRELRRIAPLPRDAAEARDAVVAALARAALAGWTVPALDDAQARRLADGTVELDLISHCLQLHPLGALRILDRRGRDAVYFDLPGAGGQRCATPVVHRGAAGRETGRALAVPAACAAGAPPLAPRAPVGRR